jgi:hypothetical protein
MWGGEGLFGYGSTYLESLLDKLLQDSHLRIVPSLQQTFSMNTIQTTKGLGHRKDNILLLMLKRLTYVDNGTGGLD